MVITSFVSGLLKYIPSLANYLPKLLKYYICVCCFCVCGVKQVHHEDTVFSIASQFSGRRAGTTLIAEVHTMLTDFMVYFVVYCVVLCCHGYCCVLWWPMVCHWGNEKRATFMKSCICLVFHLACNELAYNDK